MKTQVCRRLLGAATFFQALGQPLEPFQEVRPRLLFPHRDYPSTQLASEIGRNSANELFDHRKRHDAAKNQQAQRFKSHPQCQRSIFNVRSATA